MTWLAQGHRARRQQSVDCRARPLILKTVCVFPASLTLWETQLLAGKWSCPARGWFNGWHWPLEVSAEMPSLLLDLTAALCVRGSCGLQLSESWGRLAPCKKQEHNLAPLNWFANVLKNCGNPFKFYTHSNFGGKHNEKGKSAPYNGGRKRSSILFYFYPGHKESKTHYEYLIIWISNISLEWSTKGNLKKY